MPTMTMTAMRKTPPKGKSEKATKAVAAAKRPVKRLFSGMKKSPSNDHDADDGY